MENFAVFGNKKLEGKRRDQKEEMWGPTRMGSSFGGKPPLSPGPCHQPVPLWEKKFCTSVCSISWKTLCETKKLMYMYPTIVEWDDSEGEEAFRNAKARYWAKINHLPCPIPLPDPDIYIDTVDYNAVLDPELVEDLYKQPPPSQDDGEKGIVWDSFQFTTDTVPVTGWGDEEDGPTIYATDQSVQIQPTGWGDDEEVPTIHNMAQSIVEIQPTGWGDEEDQPADIYPHDQSIQIQPTGWVDTKNLTSEIIHEDLFPRNNSETKDNCGDYQCNWDYSWQRQACRNGHGRRGHGRSRATGRYRGRKKANCANEQTVHCKPQWDSMPSYGPTDHGKPADYSCTWQWQKSVS